MALLVMICVGGLGRPGNARNGLEDGDKRQQTAQKSR